MKELEGPVAQVTILRQLFGQNRAEWPSGSFKELFVPPVYLNKLESMRPSILIGGRGTGKTTSLQSLKYDETLTRLKERGFSFSDQEYLGILVRMNKNRVHAFKGESVTDSDWEKTFAHYFNLIVCQEFCNLALWLREANEIEVAPSEISHIGIDLGVGEVDSFENLQKAIRGAISALQLFVNNPSLTEDVTFSMPESPLRTFVEVLRESGAIGERIIFCCIDEYENLLDYQQGVVNTYIKHSEKPLSYKVGVRRYGIRNWQTIDKNDRLNNPDDFAQIEIVDEGFEHFAPAVVNKRLGYAIDKGISVPSDLNEFLINMSLSEEALLLGAEKVYEEVLKELQNEDADFRLVDFLNSKPAAEGYFLKYWQEKEGGELEELVEGWMNGETTWATRIGNHGYASLFWLSLGKKGIRIRKYYSGKDTALSLSGGNIRYFLQLIDGAIYHEIEKENNPFPELLKLSAKSQTLALRDVGKRRLDQLEGLADKGVQLKRLVLAIGRVFFQFARTPANRSPETNSFVLSGNEQEIERVSKVLKDGVGHLAFEVSPRTKITSEVEVLDDEYRLHRIFSGFFEISYRKKRRATFQANQLLKVIDGKPAEAIRSLLNDDVIVEEDLPEQLEFFSAFYEDRNENNS